jgi:hypothetical protein
MRRSCNGSRYNIAEEDGEGTLITVDNWVEFIKPGMKSSMSMILRKSSAPELALVATLNAGALNWPDVDFAGTYVTSIADSHERLTHVWSSSHLCQVTFRIYEEERIVELPEIPPPEIPNPSRSSSEKPNSTPTSPQQKSKTSTPSKTPPREEDLFQRVHIIRDIMIKRRPQSEGSELQYMVAKVVEKGDVSGLKALLETYREYDKDPYPVTAARRNLQLEAFRNLIAAGEDLRAKGRRGQTPLHLTPDEHIARLLISHGADVHAVTNNGWTTLHYAEDEYIARLLISHGADVHAIDNDGKTPLHFARALGIAKALIDHGANATGVDNFGRSTVDSTRTTYFPTSEERHALVFFSRREWSGADRVRLRFRLQLNNVLEQYPERRCDFDRAAQSVLT